HLSIHVAARLPLYPPRRGAGRSVEDVSESAHHDAARWSLARRLVDVRLLGVSARNRARRDARMAARARGSSAPGAVVVRPRPWCSPHVPLRVPVLGVLPRRDLHEGARRPAPACDVYDVSPERARYRRGAARDWLTFPLRPATHVRAPAQFVCSAAGTGAGSI